MNRSLANKFAAVALAGCVLLAPRFPLLSAPKPVEIPVILSLTGNGGFIGQNEMLGLRAVEDATNKSGGIAGRPLKFSFVDDESTPQVAVQLYNAAAAEKPTVVLGSSVAATCNAISSLIRQGPLHYCLSSAVRTQPGSYTFATLMTLTDAFAAMFRYFRERGIKKIGFIASADASGQDAELALADVLAMPENASMSVVDREHFNLGDISVAAQMTRIKSAEPDLLIAYAIGPAAGLLFKGLNESGIDVPVVTSAGNTVYAQLKQLAPFLPKNLYFPGTSLNAPESARDETRKALATFNDELTALSARPELLQAASYDPGMIVVNALRKVGPDASADRLRAFLSASSDYTGVLGPYDFRRYPQRGLGASNVIVVRFDATKSSLLTAVSKPGGQPL